MTLTYFISASRHVNIVPILSMLIIWLLPNLVGPRASLSKTFKAGFANHLFYTRLSFRRKLLVRHLAYHSMILEVKSNSRSEEHTSELQSRPHLVCRLLLEKKKKTNII